MLADPERCFLHDVIELLLPPAGSLQMCCRLMVHQEQLVGWGSCGGVELVVLLLLGFQVIQQSLKVDQLGGGGCNEEALLAGQRLGQKRLEWMEF